MTRNTDKSAVNKDNVINNATIEINAFGWYIPHYLCSISEQAILSRQISNRITLEFQYIYKYRDPLS